MPLWLALIACVTAPPASDKDAVTDTGPATETDTLAADTPTTDTPSPTGDAEARAFDGGDVTITAAPDAARRTYTLRSTHPLRDGVPAGGTRTFTERDDRPRLRTGSLLFDGLFAMAIDDATQASVSQIADGGFDNGAATACDCFETGERWTYVWTRDTAFAVDLGLAWLDPVRAANSLRFKLSRPKSGGPLQIVQDTGTGGSWPVSTDRVAWALGAEAVLPFLSPEQAEAFRAEAHEALTTTTAIDRQVAFDASTGRMRGETSFLDWREQTYPPWTASDTTAIASSEALGTNVLHSSAWRVLAAISDDPTQAEAANATATALREACDAFWVEDDTLPASYRLTPFDPSSGRHYDALGLALATLEGALDGDRARQAVAAYPHTVHGPPVIWPQQPSTPIYHNRAIWPFVTAYTLLAARQVDNAAVFDHDLDSLARGAALNLSNMENFEFLSGRNWVDAGAESGPVVNSRRQLWSVGGYLGAVVHGLFGVDVTASGLSVAPYVTPTSHAAWLGDAPQVALEDFVWRDKRVHVELQLPLSAGVQGAYRVAATTLNGAAVQWPIAYDALPAEARFVVTLEPNGTADAGSLTRVEDRGDFRDFWPPAAPDAPTVARNGDDVTLAWALPPAGTVVDVYRDGQRVGTSLTEGGWRDVGMADATPCYALATRYAGYALESPHGAAACWWGDDAHRVTTLTTGRLVRTAGAGRWSEDHGRTHWMDWGAPEDSLAIEGLSVPSSGRYRLQLVVGNGSGPVNTGVTSANKRLDVWDEAGTRVGTGVATAVQRATWATWNDTTPVDVHLAAGERYRVTITDAGNMSSLAHFTRYTGGVGGGPDPSSFVNVAAVKLLALDGPRSPTPARVRYDGVDDIGSFGATALRPPLGATLAPWSGWALDADADTVWLTLVSPAFEEDYAPWLLDLAPAGFSLPGLSVPYTLGSVTAPAAVPFTPAVTIAARAVAGAGADGAPWPGVYVGGLAVFRFTPGVDLFLSADRHTLALAVPRAALGIEGPIVMAGRIVWGVPGAEWKETLPADHTPWTSDGGAALDIDLDAL
ncbi:MAG: hypothetical protein RLZZ383_1304 [Pseudomonadota bacterium]